MFENDITKCDTRHCDKKEQCYRFTCKPDRLQSYADFTNECKTDNYKYMMRVEESA